MSIRIEDVRSIISTGRPLGGARLRTIRFSQWLLIALLSATCMNTYAQPGTGILSIPSSAFTPQSSASGYGGNTTGTARFFDQGFQLLATVKLPDGAKITRMSCGGNAEPANSRLEFYLQRNEPQQSNLFLANVFTSFTPGFQFISTAAIAQPVVDNSRYSYYIQAYTNNFSPGPCPTCSIGFCRFYYVIPIFMDGFEP